MTTPERNARLRDWWQSGGRRDLLRALAAVALAWSLILGYDNLDGEHRPHEVMESVLTALLMGGRFSYQAFALGSIGLLVLVAFSWRSFLIALLLLPAPLLPGMLLEGVQYPPGLVFLPLEVLLLYAAFLRLLILPAVVKLAVSGPPWRRRPRSA